MPKNGKKYVYGVCNISEMFDYLSLYGLYDFSLKKNFVRLIIYTLGFHNIYFL